MWGNGRLVTGLQGMGALALAQGHGCCVTSSARAGRCSAWPGQKGSHSTCPQKGDELLPCGSWGKGAETGEALSSAQRQWPSPRTPESRLGSCTLLQPSADNALANSSACSALGLGFGCGADHPYRSSPIPACREKCGLEGQACTCVCGTLSSEEL